MARLDAITGQVWSPAVLAAYQDAQRSTPSSPGALHHGGSQAMALLQAARAAVAEVLGCRTDEVWFCSSGHEAARLATQGARAYAVGGTHLLAGAVERMELLDAISPGVEPPPRSEVPWEGPDGLVLLPVDAVGRVSTDALAEMLDAHPGSPVVIQQANAEVGTAQPVDPIAATCADRGVLWIMDAVGPLAYAPVAAGWSVLVADGRSVGAPPVGVLAVRSGSGWVWPETAPTLPGCAPGFSDVPAAVALATALHEHHRHLPTSEPHLRGLTDRLRANVAVSIPDVAMHGDEFARLPQTVTFSCLYLDAEAVVRALDRFAIQVGSGSACAARTGQPSHVLAAMGALTHGNVRISLPFDCPAEWVDRLLDVLPGEVAALRAEAGVLEL